MTDTQGSTHTGTALQVDLVAAKREYEGLLDQYTAVLDQRDELLEALQKIATADISDSMVRYELKEIARAAVGKVVDSRVSGVAK